jgi:hypothetical protein
MRKDKPGSGAEARFFCNFLFMHAMHELQGMFEQVAH